MMGRLGWVLVVLVAGSSGLSGVAAAAPRPETAEDLIIVDCLLPGQIRQLARNTTYLSARRPAKTTAFDCRVRNGEYVVEDRASLGTALKVWLTTAEAGDVEAQTTVGEIFERGLGVAPDFDAAATWYRRAAEAGYSRAQINLGNLYERGLGVPQDSQTALDWYRRAAGLDAAIRLDTTPDVAPILAAADAERVRLRADLERLEAETRVLRAELEAVRQGVPEAQITPDPVPELEAQVQAQAREVTALGQLLAARDDDVRALGAQLERSRAELAAQVETATKARAAIEAEAGTAAAASEAARSARADAERYGAELGLAMARMEERQRTLDARAAEVEQLKARLQSIEASERAVTPPRESDVAKALLAGPEITLIDPTLPRTRGLVKVSVPATLDRRRIVGRVNAPAGVLSVSVNGMPTAPNAAGVFVAELSLPGTESRVAVTAIDLQGKRADLEFVLAPTEGSVATVVATPSQSESAARRVEFGPYHALLIGNEKYQRLPALNTPVEDVNALDHVLRTRYGFETTVLRNAPRYEILSALNELREKLTSADNLLLYYAGHGELDEVNMRGHWLPVDAEADSTANWISNVTITDILNVMKAKQILLVVDSCYSGTLTRSSIAGQETAQTDQERLTWLELMATKRARVVLTSGGLAPVLDAGGGRHSVFAKALLQTLESTDEITEGQVLYRALAARVAHAAAGFRFEQTPQFAPIAHAGHESGDFFLLPRLD